MSNGLIYVLGALLRFVKHWMIFFNGSICTYLTICMYNTLNLIFC